MTSTFSFIEAGTQPFRAVPFWAWNEQLDPETCRAQVRELAVAGYGGAYMHARLGMLTPYMHETFMACVRASVDEASLLGLRMHLYDEDRWPSGWASGQVPLSNPTFRLKALLRCPLAEADGPNRRILATAAAGDAYCVETMALGHPKFNGTCYVDLMDPVVVRHFLEVTHEVYARHLSDSLGKQLPSIFTDEPALTYLYTWPAGGLPWTDALPTLFKARTGRDLLDCLDMLFVDQPDSATIRIQYYRLCAELFEEAFMRQSQLWCQSHGLVWTGHFMYEHSLPLHFSWAVNSHPSYRYFDWPGVDHLGRQVSEVVTAVGCRSAVHQFGKPRMMSELFGCGGQHLSFADRRWIAAQQMVLGANHLVPHFMSYSLVGPRKRDYPPAISYQQPWWPLNHILESYLARFCELMARGRGLPDLLVIHPQETVFARSRGPVPLANATSWMGRLFFQSDQPDMQALDNSWKALSRQLLDLGYVFDFGDEKILAECGRIDNSASHPVLHVGQATYQAVVLPPLETLRATTLELLEQFLTAGGHVFCIGRRLTLLDGEITPAITQRINAFFQRVICVPPDSELAASKLLHVAPPMIGIHGTNGAPCHCVWRYTRELDQGRLTLLVNLDRRRAREIALDFKASSSAAACWVWDGASSNALSVQRIYGVPHKLHLEPGAVRIFVEGSLPDLPFALAPSTPLPAHTIEAASLSWQVQRLDENALVLDTASFRIAGRDWSHPWPLLAIKEYLDQQHYNGLLELQFVFHAELDSTTCTTLRLVVEQPDQCRIEFNGNAISPPAADSVCWRDIRWHPVALPAAALRLKNLLLIQIPAFQHGDPAHGADTAHRLGTALENVFILGDFAVEGSTTAGPQDWAHQFDPHSGVPQADLLPPQRLHYYLSAMHLAPPRRLLPGDVTPQGLPFYCGRLSYTASYCHNSNRQQRICLRVSHMTAPVAELFVNDRSAGILAWEPLELDVTDLLKEGENAFTCVLYHSLRNLLGPHHHPDGEPLYVNPESFRPEGFSGWMEALEANQVIPNWSPTYCVVEFGLFADAPH